MVVVKKIQFYTAFILDNILAFWLFFMLVYCLPLLYLNPFKRVKDDTIVC